MIVGDITLIVVFHTSSPDPIKQREAVEGAQRQRHMYRQWRRTDKILFTEQDVPRVRLHRQA